MHTDGQTDARYSAGITCLIKDSIFLHFLAYFPKMEADFSYHQSVCVCVCLCVVLLKYTDISELFTASIIRAMMEAVHTSDMSVYFNKTTWRYIQESCHLHTCSCENLKSH
jgi:hypothetical protein